jgi:hypothetical protein
LTFDFSELRRGFALRLRRPKASQQYIDILLDLLVPNIPACDSAFNTHCLLLIDYRGYALAP